VLAPISLPQHIFANSSIEGDNIKAAPDLEANLSDRADVDLQFAVTIQHPRGFDGKGLDLAVGDGSVVNLRPHHPLDVGRNDTLVGEYHLVADGLEDGKYLLAGDEELADRV